jgi:hypothetical protein
MGWVCWNGKIAQDWEKSIFHWPKLDQFFLGRKAFILTLNKKAYCIMEKEEKMIAKEKGGTDMKL